MHKILRIAQREYVETARTRTFLVSVLLVPAVIVTVILVIGHLSQRTTRGPRPVRRVAVTDLSNELSGELDSVFEEHNASHPQRQVLLTLCQVDQRDFETRCEALKQDAREGKFDGYLVVAEDAVAGDGTAQYYTRNVTDFDLFATVRRLVNAAVFNRRLRAHELSPELIAELRDPIPVEQLDVRGGAEKKRDPFAASNVAFFFLFMMFLGVFGPAGQMMLTGVIEEKTSRVIEVLLSAVSPFQLMAGKILGLAVLGLTLVAIWGAAAYAAAVSQGMGGAVSLCIVVYFAVYFILGFLLLSSLFGAIGSACNTFKEAQALMMPLTMLLIVPMLTWFPIAQHPEGTLATVLSFIPPLTPMVMILRLAVRPDLDPFQIVASIAVLAASVPVAVWASAKIFRTGILMYGKPPTMRELIRWLRYG